MQIKHLKLSHFDGEFDIYIQCSFDVLTDQESIDWSPDICIIYLFFSAFRCNAIEEQSMTCTRNEHENLAKKKNKPTKNALNVVRLPSNSLNTFCDFFSLQVANL